MTKRGVYAFKLSEKEAESLKMYFAKFPEKSKSELLAEIVLNFVSNALGLKQHVSSDPSESSPEGSFSPKRSEGSEGKGLPQETQSIMEQAKECPYRAIDPETQKWYCDGTAIPKIVCIRRQQRFIHFSKNCYPKGMKRRSTSRRPSQKRDREKEDPFDATKPFRGYGGEDVDLTRYKGDY